MGIQGLRAFRHRNYRLFFGGQAVSFVGTWMQQVAQGWLVLQLTEDPLWLGVLATAQFGPVILLGLFGGLVADHLPKRQTLFATQTVAMVLAFALFGLTAAGIVEVWHVMLLAAMLGVITAIDVPTRHAFAAELVQPHDLRSAVGLNVALFNGSRILGPAAAGLLIGAFDISAAFLINGVSYVAVLIGYLLMDDAEFLRARPLARPTSARAVVADLAEGARYVLATPLVLLAVVIVGLVATFGMNFQVLVPPLADGVLNVGASGFGFLMAAAGVGATIAALGVAFSRQVGPYPMVAGAVVLGVALIVLGLAESYALSLTAMFLAGIGSIATAVTANTMIQISVPHHLRGRVMSIYATTFAGSVPIGGLLAGAIASRWGASVALFLGGLVTMAIGVGGLAVLRVIRRTDSQQGMHTRVNS